MTEIKICGMVCEEDIELVNEAGPDYVGFILYVAKSKRNLSIEEARRLAGRVRPGISRVAVTISPDLDQIRELEAGDYFDVLQIHGSFGEDLYQEVRLPVIRAFNVDNLHEFERLRDKEKIAGFLFDSKVPGSGRTFDWGLISSLDRRGKKIFLAGGIDDNNVLEAIRKVGPDVIDLSSAVEKPDRMVGTVLRSGGKDPGKTNKLIRMVHNEE